MIKIREYIVSKNKVTKIEEILCSSLLKVGNASVDLRTLLLSYLGLQLAHLLTPLCHTSHVQVNWI